VSKDDDEIELVRRTAKPTLVREVINDSIRRTPYWNEYRLHYDTVDGLDLHVMVGGTEVGDIRFWRGRASPPFGNRERNLLRLLVTAMYVGGDNTAQKLAETLLATIMSEKTKHVMLVSVPSTIGPHTQATPSV